MRTRPATRRPETPRAAPPTPVPPAADAVATVVARNVHGHRTRRGLTLEALARASGVSKGMLVQIEQAATNPSIATLCRVAAALGVGVARLVEVAEEPVIRVIAPRETATLWRGRPGSEARLLVGSEGAEVTELWDWRLAPGDAYSGLAHPHGCRELLHVLGGELTLVLDSATRRVTEGETVMFRADRPHRYANEAKRPLRFVMVVIEPLATGGDAYAASLGVIDTSSRAEPRKATTVAGRPMASRVKTR
ncbi:MAG: XRE family transcriptional regulator [Vicinamibacterales bacterium]